LGWVAAWFAAIAWPADEGDHLFKPGLASACVAALFWFLFEKLGAQQSEAKMVGQLALLMGGGTAGGLLGRWAEQQREKAVKAPSHD
jgi:hypothetical protein